MLNATKEFQDRMNAGTPIVCHADVVFSNGESLKLTHSDFMSTGNSVNDCADNKSFPVGTAVAKSATITLSNHQRKFDNYDFFGAKITLYAVMQLDNTVERLRKGVFYVITPVSPGETIQLTMIDDMHKFDKTYETKISFPATIGSMVRDSCSICGVQLDSIAFPNDSFIIEEMPENITHRQVIAAAAMISGGNARIDVNGRLKIVEYSERVFNTLDGGVFDENTPYSSGDSFDGGNFSDYNSGDSFDGGVFGDRDDIHVVYRFRNAPIVSTDDITITGIMLKSDETEYQYGKDDYVLAFENPLVKGHESEFCEYLANKLVGLTVRPMSGDIMTNPLMEFGDPMLFVDRRGNSYMTIITDVSYNFLGYTTIKCQAEDKISNKAQIPSWSEQTYQKLRKELSRNKTEWEKAVENLANALANSSGLYITTEVQEDGSSIYYMHNKPTLDESDIIWKLTAEAFGISTDGGKTYPFGFTVTGEMITKILNTIGLNADWINTGAFVVKDAHGNVMFLADTATGRVVIVADEFMLRGKTIEELSQEANEAILDALAQDIQTQLDGKIETYNQTSDPSTAWTTTAAKQAHTGDLWYSSSTKLTKRWTGVAWVTLDATDTVAQGLAKAAAKVFVNTPTPPYKVGDVWIGNSASDMKRCQIARSSGSYVSSDWIKAVKYTDDTVAWNAYYEAQDALAAAVNPEKYLSQLEVFNLLTQNGKKKLIQMTSDGELYINASFINSGYLSAAFIKGGTLRLGGSGNQNGILQVYDSNGNIMCQIDRVSLNIAQGNIILNMDGSAVFKKITTTGGTFNKATIKDGTIEIYRSTINVDSLVRIATAGVYIRYTNIIVEGESNYNCVAIEQTSATSGLGRIRVRQVGGSSQTTITGGNISCVKLTQSSDARLKDDIKSYDERYEKFFDLLCPVRFHWKDGADRKYHTGYIAQEVYEAILDAGLDADDFGGYLEEDEVKARSVFNEDGVETTEDYHTGDKTYSLGYTEFVSLNTHMIQKNRTEIKTLKKENESLREELDLLKERMRKMEELLTGGDSQ